MMRRNAKMNSNQIIILSVFLGYLLFNVIVSFVYSRKAEKSLNTSEEKKYFIGGRNMNGIVLAMTIMATYTSASSFISGPGAAGLTYGYAQAWIAAIQVPVTFFSAWSARKQVGAGFKKNRSSNCSWIF